MFYACQVGCLAEVSSVNPSSEQAEMQNNSLLVLSPRAFQDFLFTSHKLHSQGEFYSAI